MQQILINNAVEKVAHDYLCGLNEKDIRKNAFSELKKLFSSFDDKTIIREYKTGKNTTASFKIIEVQSYIKRIMDRYDSLRIMHPSNFYKEIREFEKYIDRSKINCKIIENGIIKDSLSSRIVKAMGYIDMREHVYPKIARELNIKTCVYCNANYTITDRGGNAYYDLDHWKPKSKYPYLCTSFFNLQPSCPSCNRRKSDNDDKKFFQLWNDGFRKDLAVYKFHLDSISKLDYYIKMDSTKLKIEIWSNKSKDKSVVSDSEEKLHLSDRYKEHLDVVEEILWKKQIYNKSFLQQLENSKVLVNQANVNRFIIGTYAEPENVHLRPLTKMVQDIAKEEGLI